MAPIEPEHRAESRHGERQALAIGIAASVLLHAALLVALPRLAVDAIDVAIPPLTVNLAPPAAVPPASPEATPLSRPEPAPQPARASVPKPAPKPAPKPPPRPPRSPKQQPEPPARPAEVAPPAPRLTPPSPAPTAAAPTPSAAGSGPAVEPVTTMSGSGPSPAPIASEKVVPPSYSAAYLDNPAPRYPLAARRNGEEGTVLLKVLVSAAGRPVEVELEGSSGSARLDHAAAEAVRKWRFVPARSGADPVQAWVRVPIVFRLNDNS